MCSYYLFYPFIFILNRTKWLDIAIESTKIGNQEGVELVDINVINSEQDLVRVLVTMKKGSVSITTFGEADRKNCFNPYLAAMSEKRGIDRAILKLINAYEYGVYSEVEADAFDKKKNASKDMTEEQKKRSVNALCVKKEIWDRNNPDSYQE